MTCEEILEKLEQLSPSSFAMDWDNSGFLVGDRKKEVRRVLIAVDATKEVIQEAIDKNADFILTHHPMIFKPVKRVTKDDVLGEKIMLLCEHGIGLCCMHTNFDVMGMADAAADLLRLKDREVLEKTYEDDVSQEGIGRTGKLTEHMKLDDFAAFVKSAFHLEQVRVYGDPDDTVVTCAVLPGSGKDEIDLAIAAGADVMVTGDVNHHAGLDAVEKGIDLIDAGHYGVEKLFVPYMEDYLHRNLPSLETIAAPEGEPCRLI